MPFFQRPFILTLARLASVAVALAALAGAGAYSQQSVSNDNGGGSGGVVVIEGADMVEVCSGACTLFSVSNPAARFELRAGTLYAEKHVEAYTVLFGPSASGREIIGMTIPPLVKDTPPSCFLPSSKVGGDVACYPSSSTAEPRRSSTAEVRRSSDAVVTPAPKGPGLLGGTIVLANVGPAPRIPVIATAVRLKSDIVTGKWVTSSGVNNAPWVIQLTVNGRRIIGTVGQGAKGNDSTAGIEDGGIEGNRLWFKAANLEDVQRRVVFTGTITGDEMTLTRAVEILSGGSGGKGIWGSEGPLTFTAQRDTSGVGPFAIESDEKGNFQFASLPPGHYQIRAGLPGFTRYFPGVVSPEDASVITVGPGDKNSGSLRLWFPVPNPEQSRQ